MFKFALVALSAFSVVLASTSSCGDCSPQCLDCRIRGYTRLSVDQSTADCYLEFEAPEEEQDKAPHIGPECPVIGDASLGTIEYDGTPVCRRQRCTLENGERCRLKRLNEDTCMSAISHANFALDSSLSGCFAYIDNVSTFSCPDGYTASCRYANVSDFLPTTTTTTLTTLTTSTTTSSASASASASKVRAAPAAKATTQALTTNVLDSNTVYSVLRDAPVLRAQVLDPTESNPTPCPNTILHDGKTLELIAEGCLEAASTFPLTDIAALLKYNLACNRSYRPLVVSGLAGCYKVLDSTATCPSAFLRKSANELAEVEQGIPSFVISFPKCFYRLADNDIDPAGCQNHRHH